MGTKNGKVDRLAAILAAAGDPVRLEILSLVSGVSRICVSDVSERLGMSVAATSHHLRVLAREGLLEPVRAGKRICYVYQPGGAADDIRELVRKHIH